MVTTTVTAQAALTEWEENPFDLILINAGDENLCEARQFCQDLRAFVANPIIFLTEDSRESNQVEIYEAGVDECIVMPITVRLLMTKLVAWLRRSWKIPTETLDTLHTGTFQLDSVRRYLIDDCGKQTKLTNLEFRLMHLFLNNPNCVLESSLILNRVWGHSAGGDCTLLKHLVYRLRRKIEPNPGDPRYLQTASGEGYIFLP